MTAFRSARRVSIGLTTDRYVDRHLKPFRRRIQPYRSRRRRLLRFLRERFAGRAWSVEPLEDRFGGSVRPGPDLILVSASTRHGAQAINRERARRGLAPLEIREVEFVRGDDGLPVSSRRIRAGLVREDGRRRGPVRIRYVGRSRYLPSVRSGIRRAGLEAGVRIVARGRPERRASTRPMAIEYVLEVRQSLRPRGVWIRISAWSPGLPKELGARHSVRLASDEPTALQRGIGRLLRAATGLPPAKGSSGLRRSSRPWRRTSG